MVSAHSNIDSVTSGNDTDTASDDRSSLVHLAVSQWSSSQVLDGEEVVNLPFVGSRIAERVKQIPSARQGAAAKNGTTDLFVQPVSLPKSINRCSLSSVSHCSGNQCAP